MNQHCHIRIVIASVLLSTLFWCPSLLAQNPLAKLNQIEWQGVYSGGKVTELVIWKSSSRGYRGTVKFEGIAGRCEISAALEGSDLVGVYTSASSSKSYGFTMLESGGALTFKTGKKDSYDVTRQKGAAPVGQWMSESMELDVSVDPDKSALGSALLASMRIGSERFHCEGEFRNGLWAGTFSAKRGDSFTFAAYLHSTLKELIFLSDGNRVTLRPELKPLPPFGKIGDKLEFKLPGGEKLILRYCPGGTFTMGNGEAEAYHTNEAQVKVKLSSHYWMAETECTQEQWGTLMRSNPSKYKGKSMPVENVSWEDAQRYVKKLNAQVKPPKGWKWSLPTEAQWEMACRAGTMTPFSFGTSLTRREARFDVQYRVNAVWQGAKPVGSYEANSYGLHDMHGNVEEWCQDASEQRLPGGLNPEIVGTKRDSRVYRGGGWDSSARGCRSAYRPSNSPTYRTSMLGFRPALVLDPESKPLLPLRSTDELSASKPKPAKVASNVKKTGTPREIGETIDESVSAFAAGHRRTIAGEDPKLWAGRFAEGATYCYFDRPATKSMLIDDRQKLLKRYPSRIYTFGKATHRAYDGGSKVELTFPYSFKYKTPGKAVRQGSTVETLHIKWAGNRWLIFDYSEKVKSRKE